MSMHNIYSKLNLAEMPTTGVILGAPEGKTFAWGTSVPSATTGYAPGCIFVDTSAGLVYRNSGTVSSCTFTLLVGSTVQVDNLTLLNDAGSVDARLVLTTQTGTKPDLTIPDFAGVNDEFVFKTLAQTLVGKTLTTPTINGATLSVASAGSKYMVITCGTTLNTANRTLTITIPDAATGITLGGSLTTGGAWTQTGAHSIGITTQHNGTFAFADSSAYALTFPTGTVTLAKVLTTTQGDIVFRGASADERLPVGTAGQALLNGGAGADLYWGDPSVGVAAKIANGATLEDAGALDATLAFTQQTVGAPVLTIPNFASVSDTFAFVTLAQTLANKTLTAPVINGGTLNVASAGSKYMVITCGSTLNTANRTLTVTIPDSATALTLTGDLIRVGAHSLTLTTTNTTDVTLPTTGTLAVVGGALGAAGIVGGTAIELTSFSLRSSGAAFDLIIDTTAAYDADRTLTLNIPTGGNASVTLGGNVSFAGAMSFAGAWTHTGAHTVGITTQANGTFAFSGAGAYALTFPAATDTLVGKATTDTLTNKTLDCDGTGNHLSNVNATELDPITVAGGATAFAVPFLIVKSMSNVAAAGSDIYTDNCPYKLKILDVWSKCIGGTGDWTLYHGKAGALGNAITDTVAVAGDKDLDRAGEIDDGEDTIAANESLALVGDVGGALDVELYIECIRLD